ncbi:hypothetical protein ACHAWF_016207 [Thalassiosira exigua]
MASYATASGGIGGGGGSGAGPAGGAGAGRGRGGGGDVPPRPASAAPSAAAAPPPPRRYPAPTYASPYQPYGLNGGSGGTGAGGRGGVGGGGGGGASGGDRPANGRLSAASSSRPPLPLRPRDAAAALACLFLLRLAFAPPSGGIGEDAATTSGASARLAFYAPFRSRAPPDVAVAAGGGGRRAARPIPLDADGDGSIESLVLPAFLTRGEAAKERASERELREKKRKRERKFATRVEAPEDDAAASEGWDERGSWGLRVLDLGALRDGTREGEGGTIAGSPFVPRSSFLSPLLPGGEGSGDGVDPGAQAYPVKLLALQVPVRRTRLGEEERSRRRHQKAAGGNRSPSSSGSHYGKNSEIPAKDDPKFASYDRTRHYFCGRDWHHAADSCHRHCVGGTSDECGEGETCYADTPCDVHLLEGDSGSGSADDAAVDESPAAKLALTKAGTLPGVAAVWSDGSATLHVVTADVVASSAAAGGSDGRRPKRARQGAKKPALELRQLWRVRPLDPPPAEGTTVSAAEFEELGIAFESGAIYGGSNAGGEEEDRGGGAARRPGDNGAILLGGKYTLVSEGGATGPLKSSFHALDAMTGTSLWELSGDHRRRDGSDGAPGGGGGADDEGPAVPIVHTTSHARRRSHLPAVADALDPEYEDDRASFAEGDDVSTSEECSARFRASVLDPEGGALPHEFWDDELGSLGVGRFDRGRTLGGGRRRKAPLKKGRGLARGKRPGGVGGAAVSLSGADAGSGGRAGHKGGGGGGSRDRRRGGWQSELVRRAVPRRFIKQRLYDARRPHMGKPNVVLFHGREGLSVLSLKNGRPVCHISLTEHSLYADMDRDGVVDTVQVVTSPSGFKKSSAVQGLLQRIGQEASQWSSQPNAPVICHALVTSGLPPREEVFTAPLCLGGPTSPRPSAAPPLLVEGSAGYGDDVIFAANNGVVVRYDFDGREVWRKRGGLRDGTPTWDAFAPRNGRSPSSPEPSPPSAAFLGRIQFGPARESRASVSASSRRDQHRPGSPARPILLSGEDGVALLSPATGKVLASAAYPQRVAGPPILADLDGDGTDDLVVVSDDAVWGYRVVVETGRSGGFTIVVVTLLIGVALAALVHQVGRVPGQKSRRSTDA